ncbi:MAG: SDR family oxidoreductase [Rhodospirillaceae bacterium]|nr:SDR family oxidoreductase [Rhodospirillaceae bacterium]
MSIDADHFDLSSLKALVLGADTPGGAAIARAYTEAGADVTKLVSDREARSCGARSGIDDRGAACTQMAADLTEPARASEAVGEAVGAMGGLDIFVGCPDLFLARPVAETTGADLNHVMTTNFGVQFAAVRAAADNMRSFGRGGKLLLLTHLLGERGLPNTVAYAAAHAATQSLVRTLALELGREGITVNGIALGWMNWMTDRIRPDDEPASRAVRFTIFKRAGRPEDVGPMAVWLAGSGAGFVTGQVFHLDGGLTLHI